jgi:hypothetical protein
MGVRVICIGDGAFRIGNLGQVFAGVAVGPGAGFSGDSICISRNRYTVPGILYFIVSPEFWKVITRVLNQC